jgi:type I restriction enzyme S subunit
MNYGRALKANTRIAGKVPVYGTNGQCGWHDEPLAKGPGVILGRKGQGPLGVEWCESDFWVIDTAYFASTLTPDLDLKYFYHLVKHVGLNHLKDGTSNPTLSRDTFGAQLFPLPPLAEQKAIAAVLGALDDKIELNRRMNATLEATARALFQSWFVDFDPVRAKLDGRKPDGLDKPIAALFPAAFQDSPLGPIPKGWAVARLDDIASVMMGLSPDGDSYNSDGVGVPLINGPVEFGDYFPVKTKWTQASTRFAAEGDLIFCVRGSTTGRRVVSDGEYGIGRGVCAIRAKDKLDSLLYQTINVGLERLLEKTTGSVFPSLSAPDIKGFSVLKPNGDVQQLYERTTKPLVQSIQQNHRQSRTLATLRDTLLPKLLSGEVSVGDARRYAGDII